MHTYMHTMHNCIVTAKIGYLKTVQRISYSRGQNVTISHTSTKSCHCRERKIERCRIITQAYQLIFTHAGLQLHIYYYNKTLKITFHCCHCWYIQFGVCCSKYLAQKHVHNDITIKHLNLLASLPIYSYGLKPINVLIILNYISYHYTTYVLWRGNYS